MVVAVPWDLSSLDNLRWTQSGDVVYVAAEGVPPQKISRYATRSWGVSEYQPIPPFRGENATGITLTPSGLSGSITLTASQSIFESGHVGAVFRIESSGQNVTDVISTDDTFSIAIRVTGVLNGRLFGIGVTNIGTSTVALQRSVGDESSYTTVESYTTNQSKTFNDGLDNQIVYYRLGITTLGVGDSVTVSLAYDAGSTRGRARITGVTSGTVATADVESSLGALPASSSWWESAWSDYRGWPSAVQLFEGRLWWAGNARLDGSVSDAFESFDDEEEGDAGPISRTLTAGQVAQIAWLADIGALAIGTGGAEMIARASTQEEIVTNASLALRRPSTYGAQNTSPAIVDSAVAFAGQNGNRLFLLASEGNSYATNDVSVLVPEVFDSPIVRVAVQRLPDTRVHCVREDGTVAILVFDKLENLNCWVEYETDGEVFDVAVRPGEEEDAVVYAVKRTIDGNTKRYLERWALESQARGGAQTRLADCGLVYSGGATTSITGLDHIEGETVCVWGASKDLGTYVVTSGAITVNESVTWAFVGLPYTAQFKTAKLALASASGNTLTQRKRIDHIALVVRDTHAQGLQYGQDFSHLDDLPLVENGGAVDEDSVWSSGDFDSVELNGTWSTDARLCLQAQAPRPVTLLAAVLSVSEHEKF
jgi:hypothetical protein